MPYITSVERLAKAEGRAEGRRRVGSRVRPRVGPRVGPRVALAFSCDYWDACVVRCRRM